MLAQIFIMARVAALILNDVIYIVALTRHSSLHFDPFINTVLIFKLRRFGLVSDFVYARASS